MRLSVFAVALSLAACGAAVSALAQPAVDPPIASQLVDPNRPYVPAGTVVFVEINETVGSKVFKRGDKFNLRLAAPILLEGRVVVPAGVTGVGQVIDAAPSGALGKPAKLLVAARYLDLNGAQIPLRSLQLGRAGVDNTNAIMAASFVPYVGLLAMFMHGGEIDIPTGTLGQAKLAVDLDVPPAIPVSTSSEQGPR